MPTLRGRNEDRQNAPIASPAMAGSNPDPNQPGALSDSRFLFACLNNRMPYLCLRESMGPPKFSTLLFLHARHPDPGRPLGLSPRHDRRAMFVFSVGCLVSRQCHTVSPIAKSYESSVLASSLLTLSPSALIPLVCRGALTVWPYSLATIRTYSDSYRVIVERRAGLVTRFRTPCA